ncbi:MAG: DUF3857 domain-containing protein [Acidobacteria bacterium]|nr:DUF3857 domain-containing protein [Acidobacteriota bacterium]
MKKFLTTAFLLIIGMSLFAADAPTDFEKNLKPNPAKGFQDAVILSETGVIDNSYTLELSKVQHTMRMKVFTRKGIEDYGTVKISYDPHDENIGDIRATVWTPDGKVHVLNKKDIHRKKISTEWGNKETEISFALPGLEKGAIAEYSYFRSYTGLRYINFWYSQHPIYCFRSDVTFIPWATRRWGFTGGNLHARPEITRDKNTVKGTKLHVVMKDIPALPKEDYSVPYDSTREFLAFYYTDSDRKYADFWIDWGNSYYKHYVAKYFKPKHATKKLLKKELAGLTPADGIEKIHDYVTSHFIPLSTMSKDERAKLDKKYFKKLGRATTVPKMMKLKYLLGYQLNLIEGALIQTEFPTAEINYVLYLPWNKGLFNKGLHTMQQFSGSMLRVVFNGHTHWLVPSKRLLPMDMVGARGVPLLVMGKKTEFIQLKADKPEQNVTRADIDVTLGEDTLKVHQVRTMNRYESYKLRKALYYFNDDETKDLLETTLKLQYGNRLKVISQKVINLKDIHKPLILDVTFTIPYELEEAGDQTFFKPAMLTRYLTNPFNAEKRYSNIMFPYPYITEQNVVYHLSDDYTLSSLPENETIPGYAFGYSITYKKKDDHAFVVKTREHLDRNMFGRGAAPIFKNYYDRVIAVSHPSIVLKEAE